MKPDKLDKSNSNDSLLNIRINNELKNDFLNITKKQNLNASSLLRKYIKNFINRNKESLSITIDDVTK